jgi:DNA-binding MarR family transcriptional regulator
MSNEDSHASIEKIIENLIHIHPLLSKNFNRAIRTKSNINPGSLYVLGTLRKHGMLSMSEIGCKLSMPKPHVTAHIDKLIAEEMVERVNDPKDRRIINVRITEKGENDFNAIKQEITEEMRHRVEKLSDEKMKNLYESTEIVRNILTEMMEESMQNKMNCTKE